MFPEASTATIFPPEEEDEEDVVVVLSSVEVVLSVVVEVVQEPLSLLLLHEMSVRLKRNMEKKKSICFIWSPIGVLGEPQI